MSKQTWQQLVGKAVLVRDARSKNGPFEYRVVRTSPSGDSVKMQNRAGRTFWCDKDDYQFLEVIQDSNEQPKN